MAAALLVAACTTAMPLRAQSLTGAELSGSVRTAAGEVIPRPVVTVLDASENVLRTVDGGLNGSFVVRGLGPGAYTLRIEALGFAPRIYQGIRVRPGAGVRLAVVLRFGGGAADTVQAAGVGATPSSGRWLDTPELTELPVRTPDLSSWAGLSTLVDDDLGMEGLPGQFTRFLVDGIAFRPVRPAGLRTLGRGAALLTGRTLSALEVMPDPTSLELPSGAGGSISAHSIRGGPARASLDGAASAGGLRSAATDPDDAPSALSFWGGASAALVLAPDTASLTVGFDAWQVERPRAGLLPGGGATGEGLDEPWLERERGMSGFVRLDRSLDDGGMLWGTARLAVQPATTDLTSMAWGLGDPGERVDLLVGSGILLPIARRETIEARASLTRSAWTAPDEAGADLPFEGGALTLLDADSGVRVGPGPLPAGRSSRLDLEGTVTLHLERDAHRLRMGARGGVAAHEQDWGRDLAGVALLGSGIPGGAWDGVVDTRGFGAPVEATIPRIGVFLEDSWEAGSGLVLDFGGRFDSEWVPIAEQLPNPIWFTLSGLETPAYAEQVSRPSAFAGFRWDGGEGTRVAGRFSYTSDDVDPLLAGEILASTEFGVVRGRGPFPAWPGLPSSVTSPNRVQPAQAYLVEDLEAPATLRASGAFRHDAAAASIEVGGVFRRTDGLTRRRDLNRLAVPVGSDAGGRALWGQPLQVGSWLGPAPGSTSRFDAYGPTWELDQGGWSEYVGVTLRVSGAGAGGLRWSTEYTWSRTEDNVPGLALAGRLAGVPLEAVAGEEATEGVSDLDRPHRAVATLSLPLPVGQGSFVSGVYRFQSGAPFTPGYAAGVDANMDGVLGNDPAFVSSAAESAHGAEWSCLRGDVGGFARRNGCRGPDVHALDLRLSVGLPGVGGALFVDALNVLDREMSLIDTALLRVDPSGAVTGSGSNTGLPFVPNAGFGSALRDLSPGRMLRVGLRIGR